MARPGFDWLSQFPHAPRLLADADTGMSDVFFWSILLIILVIVLVIGVYFIRRALSPDEDFHGEGFTLGDFRRMHKAGKMTEEEFERAKGALLQSLKASPAKPPPDELPGGRSLRSED